MHHEMINRNWNAQVTVSVTDVPRITFPSGVEVQPHSITIRWSHWNNARPEWTVQAYKIKKDGTPGAVSRTIYHLSDEPQWVAELIKLYTPTTLVTWND